MLDTTNAAPSALGPDTLPIEPGRAGQHFNIDIEFADSLGAAEPAWRELEPCCASTPFQTFDWHRLQQSLAAEGQPIIVIGRTANGSPLFILPLALERQGPAQNLVWLSSRQASYCGGLFRPDAQSLLDRSGADWLVARIAKAVPQADALLLFDQRDDDANNPLRHLPRIGGADEGYAITLAPWQELYRSRGNRRTRHNDRRRERRLTELAPWQTRIVTSVRERRQLMQTMFAQKRVWLSDRGIRDFLAEEANRTLLLDLAASSSGAFEPVVAVLDVGGRAVAVSFGITHRDCHYSLITSIDPDERFRPYSPGDILFRHVLKVMCENGLGRFDLGLGTTLPKLQYADHRFRVFHTLMPLTHKGRIIAAVQRCQLEVKRLVKETPQMWALLQRARGMRGTVQGLFDRAPG